MARQLRIEYPGAFYHVTSRGNQKQAIVRDDQDRGTFLEFLGKAHEKLGGIIHAFCLMDDHFHLLLEPPRGDLSRFMHFVKTSYSVYYNARYSRVGHLFQGRFKAILIEADAYAQTVSRYIHLNPVRAGRDMPAARRLRERPTLSKIRDAVGFALGQENNFTRDAAIYLTHAKFDFRLKEIAAFYSLGPSAISSITRKMRKNLGWNIVVKNVLDLVENELLLPPRMNDRAAEIPAIPKLAIRRPGPSRRDPGRGGKLHA